MALCGPRRAGSWVARGRLHAVPAAATTAIHITCAKLGSEITVGTNVSTFIKDNPRTRIQTSFFRSNFTSKVNAGAIPNKANIIVGHGQVGFTTP